VIADRYARDTGLELREMPTLMHNDRPWQRGTPDRLAYEWEAVTAAIGCVTPVDPDVTTGVLRPERGLEIKSHGFYGGRDYGEEGTDEIPPDKRIQCAWYMSLLDVDVWDLAALFDTHCYRVFRVPRDKELEAYLLEEGDLFWRKHVLERRAPEADGSDSFNQYLRDRFTKHDTELIRADMSMVSVLEQYKVARDRLKEAETDKKLLSQLVQTLIGDHAGAERDGKTLVTWKQDARGKVSSKKLLTKCRDMLGLTDDEWQRLEEECRGEPHRRFLVK
jgi:hypothetical protein